MQQQEEPRRTSPDVFLRLIEKSRRGNLKIYIGHAAGVGKTYQMLEDAHVLKQQGADVVAGIIETHGRSETAAKTEGLEVLPRRKVSYKGRQLEEMDLPAILRRKPEIVLVDELAHTNVPGLENEKRYQDVEEILEAGISVMTTVNIQHFESVQEIVSRVTGVDVRERVPDRLLRQADAMVNVDLPSDELRERLKAGKIYPADRVPAALENFFKEENLASLRELAMRQIADRLEAERRGGADRSLPAAPVAAKVMVAMSSTGDDEALLRRASAIAGAQLNWFAVYVRTKRDGPQRIPLASTGFPSVTLAWIGAGWPGSRARRRRELLWPPPAGVSWPSSGRAGGAGSESSSAEARSTRSRDREPGSTSTKRKRRTSTADQSRRQRPMSRHVPTRVQRPGILAEQSFSSNGHRRAKRGRLRSRAARRSRSKRSGVAASQRAAGRPV